MRGRVARLDQLTGSCAAGACGSITCSTFPSLLLFAGANMLVPLGADGAAIADSRWYSVTFVLGFLWLTTFLNILGFAAGKWIQNIGSVATWIPAALLIAAGAIAFATFGSATSFAPSELIPRDNFMDTMSLWSSLCFAFSGFEISSMVGQEVYDPRKTIPRSIVLSGIAITAIYILSSASDSSRFRRASWPSAAASPMPSSSSAVVSASRGSAPLSVCCCSLDRLAARAPGLPAPRACRSPPASTRPCRRRSRSCIRSIERRMSRSSRRRSPPRCCSS